MTVDNKEPTSVPVMRTVLRWSLILTLVVAIVGGIVGWFVADWSGVWSALVAALIVLIFTGVTAVSIILAARYPATYFMGIILGAWIVKLVAFLGALALVRAFEFTHDWMLWSTMLVALIGTLAIDVIAVMRARQPYVSDVQLPSSAPETDQ